MSCTSDPSQHNFVDCKQVAEDHGMWATKVNIEDQESRMELSDEITKTLEWYFEYETEK